MASPSAADNEEVRDDVVDELLRSSGKDDLEDDIDPRSQNDHGIAAAPTNMSQAITAMSESLQHMQSQSLSNRVESARKSGKLTDSQPESGQESDSESLLTSTAAGPETKKRSTAEDEDPLLDEISQTLEETEKTSPKIAPKLANIINKRWLNKPTDDQLKEKQNKYFRKATRLIGKRTNTRRTSRRGPTT
jgi:hypothetical protein